MTSRVGFGAWVLANFQKIVECLRKDRTRIAVVVVLLTITGAALGRMTRSTTSTAQLVMTPIPLRESFDPEKQADVLPRMISRPMDVKTASLICLSDEVLRTTCDTLNASGRLYREIKELVRLKKSLNFKITIAKETPYETVYSPVIELTAKARTPFETQLIVNTWAKVCVDAAEKFQRANQGPAQEAFAEQANAMLTTLHDAEQEYEEFRKEHNLIHLQARLETLVKVLTNFDDIRAQLQQEKEQSKARAAVFEAQKQAEDPKITLDWIPSEGLLATLGEKLGTTVSDEAVGRQALSVEQINDIYIRVSAELALDLAMQSGAEAQLTHLERLVETYDKELRDVQVELAQTETEDTRLARNVEILEEAYKDAASKREYAQLASKLDQPPLQLLSGGTEWRAPRFRRAIAFGFAAGAWGFLAASFLSVFVRMVLKPALKA